MKNHPIMKFLPILFLLVISCISVPKKAVFQIYQENTGQKKPDKNLYFLFHKKYGKEVEVKSDENPIRRIEQKSPNFFLYSIPKPENQIILLIDDVSINLSKAEVENYSSIDLVKEKNIYKIYLYNSYYFNSQKPENFKLISERNF